MKISLWSIGKSNDTYVQEGIAEFTKRISKYFPVERTLIPAPKQAASMTEAELKKKEAGMVLDMLKPDDFLVALDEKGKEIDSPALAVFLQQRATESTRHLVFLIGGAYGMDPSLLNRSRFTWSLSKLTFPHQLVRLILSEQLYRACSILHNEKYHHK